MLTYRSMIVGCGNIAGGYDNEHVDSARPPLTHAKAYRVHDDFECVAVVDPDEAKRKSFQKRWAIDLGFSSIEDSVMSGLRIDVVSICTPSDYHGKHAKDVLDLKPRVVFCEKPLDLNFQHATEIVKLYEQKDICLIVNYSRRFDPSVLSFRQRISDGVYGKLRAISGWYNKGLLNNGSHLLDLLIGYFGHLSLDFVGVPIFDFRDDDPSVPVVLRTQEGVPITLSCGNAKDFAVIELEFLFSGARVKMLNGGRSWSVELVVDDLAYSGYKTLGPVTITEGGYTQAFPCALDTVSNVLGEDGSPHSTVKRALAVMKLHSEICSEL